MSSQESRIIFPFLSTVILFYQRLQSFRGISVIMSFYHIRSRQRAKMCPYCPVEWYFISVIRTRLMGSIRDVRTIQVGITVKKIHLLNVGHIFHTVICSYIVLARSGLGKILLNPQNHDSHVLITSYSKPSN